jgi:Tfp pilus assembly protein PilF
MTSRRWVLLAGSLVALALLASLVGIANEFTYDDRYIVLADDRIHSLARWWTYFRETYWPSQWSTDGYRPLTLLAFALEWAIGRGAPWVFHLTNILLNAACAVALFWMASAIMRVQWAWLAAACFAVHPVHVEAVANVVGQSELWAALLLMLAAGRYLHRRITGTFERRDAVIVGALYVVACFFKEHAIVFPALLGIAELTVIPDPRPLRVRAVALRPFALSLALCGVAYMGARTLALGGEIAGFQPFTAFQVLELSNTNRVLTMVGLVPVGLRLLLWPARLSSDYSPPQVDIAEGAHLNQLPGALLLVGILALSVLLVKKRPAITFGVGWLVIALLPSSNLLAPAGFILAERTLFLGSVGAMIAVASTVELLWPRLAQRQLSMSGVAALGIIIALGAWKSHDRTQVWHDNERLFTQGVKDAPQGYRAHYMLSAVYVDSKRFTAAQPEFLRALDLFPKDGTMTFAMAQELRRNGNCSAAVPLYEFTYRHDPDFASGHLEYGWCLLMAFRFDEARAQALDALRHGARYKEVRAMIANADSAKAGYARKARERQQKAGN